MLSHLFLISLLALESVWGSAKRPRADDHDMDMSNFPEVHTRRDLILNAKRSKSRPGNSAFDASIHELTPTTPNDLRYALPNLPLWLQSVFADFGIYTDAFVPLASSSLEGQVGEFFAKHFPWANALKSQLAIYSQYLTSLDSASSYEPLGQLLLSINATMEGPELSVYLLESLFRMEVAAGRLMEVARRLAPWGMPLHPLVPNRVHKLADVQEEINRLSIVEALSHGYELTPSQEQFIIDLTMGEAYALSSLMLHFRTLTSAILLLADADDLVAFRSYLSNNEAVSPQPLYEILARIIIKALPPSHRSFIEIEHDILNFLQNHLIPIRHGQEEVDGIHLRSSMDAKGWLQLSAPIIYRIAGIPYSPGAPLTFQLS